MSSHKLYFAVRVPDKVKKQVSKIPKHYQKAVYLALKDLESKPFQGKKLEDKLKNKYSVRIGVYRILYEIYKKELIILVISVGHRKDIYRRK